MEVVMIIECVQVVCELENLFLRCLYIDNSVFLRC